MQRIWKLSENAIEQITKFKKPSTNIKHVYVITTFILACNKTAQKRATTAQTSFFVPQTLFNNFQETSYNAFTSQSENMYNTFTKSLDRFQQNIPKHLNE